MNVVMTVSKAKETYIQVRIHEDLKGDVRITANARGLSISGLIHSLLTQAVRDEKTQYPHLFPQSEHNVNSNVIEGSEDQIKKVEPMGELSLEEKEKQKTG